MKKIAALCIFLLIIPFSLIAQDEQSIVAPGDELSRGQVLGLTGLSLGSNIAAILEMGLLTDSQMADYDFPWWMIATVATHHLPLYYLDSRKALSFSLPDAALIGGYVAAKKWPLLASVPFNLFAYDEFYSTYQIYMTARNRTSSGTYLSYPETHTRGDLLIAPFEWQNISDPLFYTTVLATSAVQVFTALRSEDAIWRTGEAWIDGTKYSPGAGMSYMAAANLVKFTATAVGEEALYRGVVYEELRSSIGPTKAKLVDMLLFPAIHIPTDIVRGKSLVNIGIQFGIRLCTTLLFDLAYDRGGLPLSTAIHTWFNFIAETMAWAKSSGVSL